MRDFKLLLSLLLIFPFCGYAQLDTVTLPMLVELFDATATQVYPPYMRNQIGLRSQTLSDSAYSDTVYFFLNSDSDNLFYNLVKSDRALGDVPCVNLSGKSLVRALRNKGIKTHVEKIYSNLYNKKISYVSFQANFIIYRLPYSGYLHMYLFETSKAIKVAEFSNTKNFIVLDIFKSD
jgi:hypothetical protein